MNSKLIVLPLALTFLASCGYFQKRTSQLSSETQSAETIRLPMTIPVVIQATELGYANGIIPIETIPAGNGFEPKINLTYSSSQTSPGLAGIGWGLSGTSIIARCSSHQAFEVRNRAIEWQDEDAFCLDGKKLLLVGGLNGKEGAKYRSYIFDGKDIILRNGYFEVRTPSGEVNQYGGNEQSRELGREGKVFSYNLNRITDRAGNSIDFRYEVEGNRAYISQIEYGGNSTFGKAHSRSILFSYEKSQPTLEQFVGGQVFTGSRILKTIALHGIGIEQYRYRLNHKISGLGRAPLLSAVDRCFKQNKCTLESKFSYSENSDLQINESSSLTWTEAAWGKSGPWTKKPTNRSFADLNNDGRLDLIGLRDDSIIFSHSSLEGLNETIEVKRDASLFWNPKVDLSALADMNQDGYIDVVLFIDRGAKPGVYVSYGSGETFGAFTQMSAAFGTGWAIKNQFRAIVDINGDGWPDVVGSRSEGAYSALNDKRGQLTGGFSPVAEVFLGKEGWMNADRPRFFVDMNSDGLADIIGFGHDSVKVALGTGVGFGEAKVWLKEFDQKRYPPRTSVHEIVDMNADGLADLLIFGPDGVDVALNDGRTFKAPQRWSNHFSLLKGYGNAVDRDRLIMDINADNYPDIIGFQKSGVEVLIGEGVPNSDKELYKTSSFSQQFKTWNNRVERLQVEDLDGNGTPEFFISLPTGLWKAEVSTPVYRLTAVETGLGEKTELTYKSTLDPQIYRSTTRPQEGHLPVSGGFLVLSEVKKSSPNGVFFNLSYSYQNAAYDRTFGFLGFAQRVTTDLLRKTRQIDSYSQDTVRLTHGSLLSTETFLLKETPQLLSSSQSTWESYSTGSHPLQLSIVESSSVTKNYDESGRTLYTALTKKEFDEFYNVSNVLTTTSDYTGEHTVEVKTRFLNDEVSGIIGLPEDVVTRTSSSTNPAVVTKRSTFAYDAYGLLVSETREPDSAQWIKTEYSRTRNGFGQIDSTLTTWGRNEGQGINFDSIENRVEFDNFGFPLLQFNALGQSTQQRFNHETGSLIEEKDLNGRMTVYEYDESLQLSKVQSPDGSLTRVGRRQCDHSCPGDAVLIEEISSEGFGNSVVYRDVLGREIRTIKSLMEGKQTVQDTEYNELGLVARTSKPYLNGESAQYWTSIAYDDYNRPTAISLPDGTSVTTLYEGYTTTSIDALGRRTIKMRDSRGLTLSIKNAKNESIEYKYDGGGRLVGIIDPSNNSTHIEYDSHGRRSRIDDPATGVTRTQYNALGLPFSISNSKTSVSSTYDVLGRILTKAIKGEGSDAIIEAFSYDQSPNGLGKLDRIAGPDSEIKFLFDEKSRLQSEVRNYLGRPYTNSYAYDERGRLKTKMLPNGLTFGYSYDEVGQLTQIYNTLGNKLYWTLEDLHASGAAKRYKLGNGAIVEKNVDVRNDRLSSELVKGVDQTLQIARSYNYDDAGNMTDRFDQVSSVKEKFSYDALDRLLTFNGPKNNLVTLEYDGMSRISSRSDLGAYSYGTNCDGSKSNPFAISSVGDKRYCTDERGNVILSGARKLKFDLTNLPTEIVEGENIVRYQYGHSKTVLRKVEVRNGKTSTTSHVSDDYEIVEDEDGLRSRAYVGDFLVIESEGSTVRENYLYKDYLGSTLASADATGNVQERMDYDPLGHRRDVKDQSWIDSSFKSKVSSRGFTGHDHIESMNLVHMKGRVYDPAIGLFLSPDPFIQDPSLVQNLNRYSYVINNPLRYTDPTGHFFKKALKSLSRGFSSAGKALGDPGRFLVNSGKKLLTASADPRYLRLAVSIAVSVIATPVPGANGYSWAQSAAYFAAVGYTSSYIASNGDNKAALRGAVTGAAFNLVGSAFHEASKGAELSSTMKLAKIASHGIVGGLSSQAAGGSFESGFWSAGLSQAAGQYEVYDKLGAREGAGGWSIAYNAGISAVVGGSVSELTGGSFEQGALDASMGRLFNDIAHVQTLAIPAAGLAALDGPLPIGDIAAAGILAGGYFYGDEVVEWVNGKIRIWSSDIGPEQGNDYTHSSTPVGHRGYELIVTPGTNTPTTINGRKYTGHSLDRMQGRGIPPTVVEDTIINGLSNPGRKSGTIEHRSRENEVRVITNSNGGVITVIPR